MAFGRQVYAATAQSLAALSHDAAETLLYKHVNALPLDAGMMGVVNVLAGAAGDAVAPLLAELVNERNQLRHSAPTRHVFDSRVADLERWLFHDGWQVQGGALVALAPAVEDATGVRDRFLQELPASGLDADGAVQQAVNDSAGSFNALPPDFNDAVVKVRIALETVARRAAVALAGRRALAYPQDSWGRALTLLRQAGAIDQQEEELLARVYTFISPGAHVPVGVSAEEWARLGRTFGLSGAYFLMKRYVAAP